jgi:hypothetical protein
MSNIETNTKYTYNRSDRYHNLSTFYSSKHHAPDRNPKPKKHSHAFDNETYESNEAANQCLSPSSSHSDSTSETTQQRLLTDSMRSSLKRGRPNTPKTGLNTDYRRRKSSVNASPEAILKAKENFEKKQKQATQNDDNLNMAILQYDDEENLNNKIFESDLISQLDDLNDAGLNDAIVDIDDEDVDNEENGNEAGQQVSSNYINPADLDVDTIENESQLEIEQKFVDIKGIRYFF